MDFVLSFVVAVAAGIVCHCVNKWLDGDEYSVTSLRHKPPYQNGIEKPQSGHSGVFRCRPQWITFFLFAYWHYSICRKVMQYTNLNT